jgi:hypothetical protein
LQRSEVVALFNTLHRISESLAAVEQFRHMYRDTQAAASAALAAQPAETKRPKQKQKQKQKQKHTGARIIAAEATSWTGAAAAVLFAAYEALRQGCKGCLEVCRRVLEPPLRELADRVTAGRSGVDL